ncbi:MAG: tandem-95 repeat protein [Euryarchaeota archaeon]|nr:tandem-95 repeat protein [Euryarchaeota archaeon]
MPKAAPVLAIVVLLAAPALASVLLADGPSPRAGRAEPAPPWAVGCRWKWAADQAVNFSIDLGLASVRITRVTGEMVDRVADLSADNGTEVYVVQAAYSETLSGTLTIMGFPTPVSWPATGNGTFLYRVPDLALVRSYQHIVVDMGSAIGTFTADTSTTASPPVEYYRFPLSVGGSWHIRSDLSVWTRTSGAGGAFETTSADQVEYDATVPRTEDAAVPAGALSCLNLTYNGTYTTGGGQPTAQNLSALYSPKATNLVHRTFSPMAGLEVLFRLSEYSLNRAPAAASPVPEASFPEDTTGSLDLYRVFSDPDAGDRLAFTAGNFTNISTTVDNSTGTATFKTPADWSGYEKVVFTATDPRGARAKAEVNVTVTPVNDAPVLVLPLPGVIMDEDTVNDTLVLSQYFDDVDFPYGDALALTFKDNGSVALGISPGGVVTLRPAVNWSGVENITVTATDRAGASADGVLKVAVLNTPDAPVVVATSHELSTPEDTGLLADLSGRFFDADLPYGDLLTFSVEDLTTGFDCDLDGRTGLLELAAPANWSGATSLLFVATDGTGRNATERVRVTVAPVNDAPVVVAVQPQNGRVTMAENSSLDLSVTVEDVDSPALSLVWLVDGVPVGNSRNITYVAGFDSAGPHNVTVRISDGEYDLERTWALSVTNVNRPPGELRILSPANGSRSVSGARVNFTGECSDPDGDPLSFTWRDTGGKVLGTGRSFETKSLSKGKHVVTLEVSDGNVTVSASVALSVTPPPSTGTPGLGPLAALAALAAAAPALSAIRARRRRRAR